MDDERDKHRETFCFASLCYVRDHSSTDVQSAIDARQELLGASFELLGAFIGLLGASIELLEAAFELLGPPPLELLGATQES